ncbi:MAG: DUF448 domain-containing protein [Mycoplasma sp.]
MKLQQLKVTKINNNRQCVITKTIHQKNEMIRFTIDGTKAIFDESQNIQARGHYIWKDLETIKSKKTFGILLNRYKVENIEEFIQEVINSIKG